jgi:hypothetical protein
MSSFDSHLAGVGLMIPFLVSTQPHTMYVQRTTILFRSIKNLWPGACVSERILNLKFCLRAPECMSGYALLEGASILPPKCINVAC